jgi:glycosyltransferase involved in cell wall biosynthesis
MKNLINYNLTTVSIGIPSYNEESNTLEILESITRSEYNRFDLCEIVISDNSTDSTPFKMSTFHDTYEYKD